MEPGGAQWIGRFPAARTFDKNCDWRRRKVHEVDGVSVSREAARGQWMASDASEALLQTVADAWKRAPDEDICKMPGELSVNREV